MTLNCIHFKPSTKSLCLSHHFTLPYDPWSNSAVERLVKELLRVARAASSECQWRPNSWNSILGFVQSPINSTPSPSRCNHAPITMFTGRPVSHPVNTFLNAESSKPIKIKDLQHQKMFKVEKVITIMDALHPLVNKCVTPHRQRIQNNVLKDSFRIFGKRLYISGTQ